MHHVSLDFPHLFYGNNSFAVFGVAHGESFGLDVDWFLTGLLNNYRSALLLFNWIGDDRALHSFINQPALDILTGALLPLGIAAWCARLARSPRDPLLWLLPALFLIMLLPMTLAVSDPIRSITRTGAVLPGIYLLVSLGVLRLAKVIARVFPRRLRWAVAVAICSSVILAANATNSELVFDIYPRLNQHPPYSHIGNTVRGLVDSGSPWSNIIIISLPHHWAGDNISVEAGDLRA